MVTASRTGSLPEAVRALYPFQGSLFTPEGKEHALHYLDEGKGEAVLMVHGNPTWSFYYRDLVNRLRSSHRCIVPDHLGCGLSDKPQDDSLYHLEAHIDRLDQLIRSLELPFFHLVVHDWGGPIGLGVALRHLDKLKRIVILNTSGFRSNRIPLRINICRTPGVGRWVIRRLNGFAGPATVMATAKGLTPAAKAGYLAPYNDWNNRIAIHQFVKDIPMDEGHHSYPTLVTIEKGLEQLTDKPMQIQWGGKDFCFDRTFYREWIRRFPNAEATYYDAAGHYVLEDAQPEVLDRIADFLSRN